LHCRRAEVGSPNEMDYDFMRGCLCVASVRFRCAIYWLGDRTGAIFDIG
jgi:hypothetical protein